MNNDRIKRAVVTASLFFLFSAALLLQSRLSGRYLAEQMVRSFYTVSRQMDGEEFETVGLPELYWQRMGDRLTEEAVSDLMESGIPYQFLYYQFEPRLTHTYVKDLTLQTSEEPDGETADGEEVYQYRAVVDFYLEKELQVLAPIEEYTYEGTIRMTRAGLLRWKVKGVSSRLVMP